MSWSGEEKYQKRYFCAVTRGRAHMHVTMSMDKSE